MGGTYNLSNFQNRDSDHPTRRKLTPVEGQENVYDVSREEGTVRVEGTPWNYDTMNKFDKKIGDMFPVKIENGGTGGTDKNSGVNNLAEIGTFTPNIYDWRTNTDIRLVEPSSPGTRTGIYYKLGRLVFAYIYIHGTIGPTDSGLLQGYFAIGRLPFYPTVSLNQSAIISEFAFVGNSSWNTSTHANGHVTTGDPHIRIYPGDGTTAMNSGIFLNSRLDTTMTMIYLTD